MRAIRLKGWEKFGRGASHLDETSWLEPSKVSKWLNRRFQNPTHYSDWPVKCSKNINLERFVLKCMHAQYSSTVFTFTSHYNLKYPSKFFSALPSYCPRLSVVLLSYDSRSTLIRLDRRFFWMGTDYLDLVLLIAQSASKVGSVPCNASAWLSISSGSFGVWWSGAGQM